MTATALPSRPSPFRLSVEQYHALVREGILTTEDRCELIDGLLVAKAIQSPPHANAGTCLSYDLHDALPAGWRARCRGPITLATSEPEPDVTVIRGDLWAFDDRHPGPAEVGVVIEVSDEELDFDRTVKGRLYAEAGIPEYWIVNIEERIVEVYTSPNPTADPPAYATRTDYAVGQSVALVLDGTAVAQLPVADLLP